MKTIAILGLLALAGCATTIQDRITAHQASFATWPPEVQAKVRVGQVQLGFSPEQVLVALGEPGLKTSAVGPKGTVEVWVYHNQAPRLSVGVGGGALGDHSAVGGGVSAGGIPLGHDTDGRVVFTEGRVSDVMIAVR